jgi:hypothetical protein
MKKNNNAYCRTCVEGCSGGLCFGQNKPKQIAQRKLKNTSETSRKIIGLNINFESEVFIQNLRNEKTIIFCNKKYGVDLL